MNIAEYTLFGDRHRGKVVKENDKTIQVWFQKKIIIRHKIKHDVKPAAEMEWGKSYYAPS